MIAKKSPLHWDQFLILSWSMDFIQPDKKLKNINPRSFFDKYVIDVDFNHRSIDEDKIQVILSIKVNDVEKPISGYQLSLKALGVFDVSEVNELENENEQYNLKIFATTNLMIGRIRGLLPVLTSQSPFGPYSIPSVDLHDLLTKKQKLVEESKEKNITTDEG